jgi:D-isomer specific 2-hydroxyacid dehydrogenase, catalytic domain
LTEKYCQHGFRLKSEMARRVFFEVSAADERYLWQHIDQDDTFSTADVCDPALIPHPARCEILSVFINSRLSERIMSNLPNLKLIATRSTGFDHIDLDCRPGLLPRTWHHSIERPGLWRQYRGRAHVRADLSLRNLVGNVSQRALPSSTFLRMGALCSTQAI